jgi:branched-chain amino acid transport system substrate-binding protein
VYANDYYPQVAAFIKQARQSGVSAPMLGNSAYAFRDLPKAIGAGARNVYYATQVYYEGAGTSPAVRAFTAAYKKKYGRLPESVNAVIGYQVMTLVLDAIRSAGTLKAANITKAMYAQRNERVAGSMLRRWVKGHPVWSTAIVGLTANGGFRQVATY